MVPVWYGTIKNPATRPLSACLVHLQDELAKLIETHHPDVAAIEGVFFAKNVKTMMILTHARGVMIAQCARLCIPVYEYQPRSVKMATAGWGAAEKAQVQKMIKTLLGLSEEPQNDAADGLALAITHLHNQTRIAVHAQEPI
jgi:crossover junction endodeoxyribonuclease RuvC